MKGLFLLLALEKQAVCVNESLCNLCQDLARIHDVLKNVFLVFPNYCLGRGLMDVAFNEYRNEFFFKMGVKMKLLFCWL